jgi:hypothetical protein
MVFYKHVLNKSEASKNILMLRRQEFPKEVFETLPARGEDVIVTDYASNVVVYSHICKKTNRVNGLSPIWKLYKHKLKEGDAIGMFIDGNNIILNFNYVKIIEIEYNSSTFKYEIKTKE